MRRVSRFSSYENVTSWIRTNDFSERKNETLKDSTIAYRVTERYIMDIRQTKAKFNCNPPVASVSFSIVGNLLDVQYYHTYNVSVFGSDQGNSVEAFNIILMN